MTSAARITALLLDWGEGDTDALNRVYPLIERELRRIAKSHLRRLRPGNTLQTTALINEAYIRLVDQKRVKWQNRSHFYAIAAEIMRRILLNYIRDGRRFKRGGGLTKVSLSGAAIISPEQSEQLLALDEAMKELAKIYPRKERVVELRFFGGLTVEEIAPILDVSIPTVKRDWSFAKAWLHREMS